MDLLLRIAGSLVGVLMVLAFLRSVLQVAIVNRRRGDWLARRVGWLVYTTIARRTLTAQLRSNTGQARMGITDVYPSADRSLVCSSASGVLIADMVFSG